MKTSEEEAGSSCGSWTQDQGEFVWMAPSTSTLSTVAIKHLLLQLIMFSHGTCKLNSLITPLALSNFNASYLARG